MSRSVNPKNTMQEMKRMGKSSKDVLDRQESIVYSEKQIKIPSYIVLKKHLLLVISVIACLFTCMGWYLGTTSWLWKEWSSWIVVISSLISTPLAVYASTRLNHLLLLTYVLVGSMEVAFKIVFLVLVFRRKKFKATECTAHAIAPSSCIGWRLDDLDLTNSVVFHTISSLTQAILIIYSIQLTIFAFKKNKKKLEQLKYMSTKKKTGIVGPYQSTSEITDSSDGIFAGQSESNDYGTFRRLFLERFKKKHHMTTAM